MHSMGQRPTARGVREPTTETIKRPDPFFELLRFLRPPLVAAPAKRGPIREPLATDSGKPQIPEGPKASAPSPMRFPAWHYKVVRTVPCAVPRLALQSGPHSPLCGSPLTIRPHSFHIRVPKKSSSFHPLVTLHSTFAFQKKHPPLTVSKSPHLKVPARKASPSDAGGSTSPSPQVSSAPAQPPPSLTAHHCQESTPDPFLHGEPTPSSAPAAKGP